VKDLPGHLKTFLGEFEAEFQGYRLNGYLGEVYWAELKTHGQLKCIGYDFSVAPHKQAHYWVFIPGVGAPSGPPMHTDLELKAMRANEDEAVLKSLLRLYAQGLHSSQIAKELSLTLDSYFGWTTGRVAMLIKKRGLKLNSKP
jgi:hypothetical protein